MTDADVKLKEKAREIIQRIGGQYCDAHVDVIFWILAAEYERGVREAVVTIQHLEWPANPVTDWRKGYARCASDSVAAILALLEPKEKLNG